MMAPKRPVQVDGNSGREKKKMKVTVARTIAIQPSSKDGSSKADGSSGVNANSLTGLPITIDVENFVESRAFEIDAMHNAMKTASASSTHRIWQTLPRHLRRRAASHDVRRVPSKLRERAVAEMDVAKKGSVKKIAHKHGKDKEVSRTETFLNRQVDKIWLETHIWHAKRMHMKDMWGYRLAYSPTEKSYRPSHRASLQHAILHDASYYSLIEISGPEHILVTMLQSFCDPQGPGAGSKRYLGGSRALDTHMYEMTMYPYNLIAPITVIWRPQSSSPSIKTEGKSIKTTDSASVSHDPSTMRSMWLRFHPSVESIVLDTLKHAASHTLSKHNNSNGQAPEVSLEIANLSRQFNVFELMGPKSSQVLHGALSPVNSENRSDFLQFWSSLVSLNSVGSMPRGMVIGLEVMDPRLNFPPKNAKPHINASGHLYAPPITLPSSILANSGIWETDVRSKLSKPRFKKKDIDERKSKSRIPGSKLQAIRQDDRIPVLLVQRSSEIVNSSDSQAIHGWTLFVPAGWGMAFFDSLTFTSTRVAGQFERQTQAYESGVPYFPRDYPSTASYQNYASERAEEEQATWARKPPAKRVNYEKLGTLDPWQPNWRKIIGISGEAIADKLVTAQREPTTDCSSWLFRGPEVSKILLTLSSVFDQRAALLSEVNKLREKRGIGRLVDSVSSATLFQGALINVKVIMCLRGAPQDLSMIYHLSDDLCRRWKRLMHSARGSSQETAEELELANVMPTEAAIVGYVTTGHYSLSRGHGFGIGAIALRHFMLLEQQSTRLHPNQQAHSKAMPMLVGVRDPNSRQCRVATLEVLVDT